MNCRRATQLISEAMDRKLSRTERMSLWIHVRICTPCRRYRRQLLMVREAIRRFAGWVDETPATQGATLPTAARKRIRDALTA